MSTTRSRRTPEQGRSSSPDSGLSEDLRTANARHLAFLESWSASQPMAMGVPLMRALTYELIQMLNHAWLSARIEATDG